MARRALLTLFTKPACTLCHELKFAIDEAADKLASRQIEVHLSEVNIDEPQHDRWRQKYCNDIPVVHLNDKVLVRHRCSPEQLERAILSSLGQSKS